MTKTNNNLRDLKLSQDEQQVILLLKIKGECLYGNIFKELNLAPTKGAEIILSLANKGYIRNTEKTSYYELVNKVKEMIISE